MERFLVDQMLIRLGRWLRLLGMDVANPDDVGDARLVLKANNERRSLITRDKALAEACRSAGIGCILIESNQLPDQLEEICAAGIDLHLNPQRCTLCNGLLEEAQCLSASQERAWQCRDCKKLYWEGSHWRSMEQTLEKIRKGRG